MSDLKIIDSRFEGTGQSQEPIVIMGGDDRNPTWDEFLEDYSDEGKECMKLIRAEIEINGWIGMTGEGQQDEGLNFLFSNGRIVGFTWRAWGDLMQAIVGKREGYMKYYM